MIGNFKIMGFSGIEAFKIQNQCTFGKSSKLFSSVCMQIMMAFEEVQIVNHLKVLFQEQSGINWRKTLIFLSTFLVCFPGSTAHIKGMARIQCCSHKGYI